MPSISSVIAPVAGIVAHQQAAPATKTDNSAATQAQNAALLGQAAVVSLSAQGKHKAASTGSNRLVDSGFEKQEVKGDKKKKGEEETQTSRAVKTAA